MAKNNFLTRWLPLVIILAVALLAVRPLMRPGFFPMHDDEQIARLVELHRGLTGGQYPVRWVGNLGFGYGYPLFNFYPPLVYWIGEVFYLVGFSLLTSTKLVIFLGFFLSGVFMYRLAREYFGKVAGLVAAVLYIFNPYHALDIYVRGALSEFFSFVFLPAIFWATRRLFRTGKAVWIVALSMFLALFLLTHNMMVMILAPAYALYLLFLFWQHGFDWKILRSLVISAGLFLLLTAFFWLPALAEKQFTLVDRLLLTELADFRAHFVYLRQLWHSPWGFGGSLFGLADGLSFEIGKIHLVFSFAAVVVGAVLVRRRAAGGPVLLFFALLLAVAVFLMSFHSRFVWELVRPLGYLQFPWRFLLLAVFAASLLGGGVIAHLFDRFAQRRFFSLLVTAGSIALAIGLNLGYFQPASWLAVTDADYTGDTEIRWRVSRMSYDFVPRQVATALSESGTTVVDISQGEIAREPYEIISGNLVVEPVRDEFHAKTFRVSGPGEFRLNTYDFPGWKAYLDGKEAEIYPTGKLHLITVSVPEGEHGLSFRFTNTPVRTAGNTLSVLGLLVSLGVLIIARKSGGTGNPHQNPDVPT